MAIECRNCGKMNVDDAVFCAHCGSKLSANVNKKKAKTKKGNENVEQAVANEVPSSGISMLGLIIFFVALVGFDTLLAMVLNQFGISHKIAFYLSSVLYVLVVGCGILELIDYSYKKKKGLEVTNKANSFAVAEIIMALFVLFANITQVLMK